MLVKKTLFLFLFLLMGISAMADTFVVTSNADAGPGTLRDALTQAAANGAAVKDYINFNLPDLSEAGRTITLISQLPDVSSNLVIDASTQAGNAFGVSNSKIILQPLHTNDLFGAFTLINVDGFEIYGMYVRDFIGIPPFQCSAALLVRSSKNVTIGAPGKGNVFVNNEFIFSTYWAYYKQNQYGELDGVENLTIYANFFGFEPDGKTYRGMTPGLNGGIDVTGCAGTITIGGASNDQRNIFGNLALPIQCRGTTAKTSHPSTFNIVNNYIDYNVDGSPSPLPNLNTGNLYFFLITPNNVAASIILPYKLYAINNKIQAPTGFSASVLSGEIICQGNQVNNEVNVISTSYASGGIGFETQDRILIGGDGPGEANSLYNTGIAATSPKSILLLKNSIYCINNGFNVPWQTDGSITPKLPVVSINNITATGVSGTATPLSRIDLFWDDDCQYCLPFTYVTTLNADASGNWQYNGSVAKGVIASSTLNGFTSLFTSATKYLGGANVISYSCSKKGSITGAKFKDTGGYQWTDQNGQIVSNQIDATNLLPGTYVLSALNGTCSTKYTYQIFDATPVINDINKKIISPSCSIGGSVTGLTLNNYDVINEASSRGDYNTYTYKWKDADGNVKSTSLDLNSVSAGTYFLEVTYKNQCTQVYGPVILQNTTGPNINQLQANIQPTNCGQSVGSITGITAMGTGLLKYSWKNDAQQEVATTANLTNMPAGKYTLQVTDETQCGPVYSSALTIPETNGITLDDNNIKTTIASCSNANGSVKGLQVTGATKYQWVNAGGAIVGTAIDLQNTIAGDYIFTASNNFGCSITKTYHVAQQAATVYPVYTNSIINACFGQANGSVSVATDALVTSARWVNSQGASVASGTVLKNAVNDIYKLYITDQNGCESLYNSYTISSIPQIKITQGSEQLVSDQCNLKTGSIKNIQVAGGTLPYSYSWRNSSNTVISTAADISGLGAGNYTLTVTDARSCFVATASYLVPDQDNIIPPPSINNIQVCSPGDITMRVNNPLSIYTYRLYSSANSQQPLDENANGVFKTPVKNNGNFYITQVSGSCESARSVVNVSVGIAAADIANTFTPNGDGINDYWKITGIENSPTALVQIFNRYGQKVFESKGYSIPFDGTFNGNTLPIGTYYYIINMGAACNIMSGSVTIIR